MTTYQGLINLCKAITNEYGVECSGCHKKVMKYYAMWHLRFCEDCMALNILSDGKTIRLPEVKKS